MRIIAFVVGIAWAVFATAIALIPASNPTNTFGWGDWLYVAAFVPAVLCLALSVYFLPGLVAHRRGHLNAAAITAANLFLGWTGIGWAVCLGWALSDKAWTGQAPAAAPALIPCPACAGMVSRMARACPACGNPIAREPTHNRIAAALLALFLGGLGLHKFYLGRAGQGVVYLLLCWTFIPALLGLIEGIAYLCSSDEGFARKYG